MGNISLTDSYVSPKAHYLLDTVLLAAESLVHRLCLPAQARVRLIGLWDSGKNRFMWQLKIEYDTAIVFVLHAIGSHEYTVDTSNTNSSKLDSVSVDEAMLERVVREKLNQEAKSEAYTDDWLRLVNDWLPPTYVMVRGNSTAPSDKRRGVRHKFFLQRHRPHQSEQNIAMFVLLGDEEVTLTALTSSTYASGYEREKLEEQRLLHEIRLAIVDARD